MGPNQTYKLLHSKGSHKQNEKTTTDWEKIFPNDVTNMGLISKICEQFIHLNNKQPKQVQTTQFKKLSEDLL